MWFLLTDAEGNRLGFSLGIGFRREQRSVEISSHSAPQAPSFTGSPSQPSSGSLRAHADLFALKAVVPVTPSMPK